MQLSFYLRNDRECEQQLTEIHPLQNYSHIVPNKAISYQSYLPATSASEGLTSTSTGGDNGQV